ncbi:MAG: hypothetical protein ACEQR8_10765 [Cypionkella sp.]
MTRLISFAGSGLTLAVLTLASPALAAGTGAGTLITNTATATYDEGGTPKTVQSNTVTLRVDELLDVANAALASGNSAVGASATSAVPFRITNSGNGDETFTLAATSAVAGNGFDATVQGIVLDTNGNNAYDPGVDTPLPTGTATPLLAPDAALTAFVLVTLPAGTPDGATGQLRLTATAATGSGTPGTVFAGAGSGGGDAVVGLTTATAPALAALVARAATVTLTKSAAVLDPFGSQRVVPGAVVTYSLVAQVTGSGSLPAVKVTDAIPPGTSYRAGTLTLDGGALTDGADSDGGQASSAGIEVALGSVAAGTSRTVSFKVTIN